MGRQRHDRGEAQPRRSRTGDGPIIPLVLRCHPQMGSRCVTCHFHRPAPTTPRQHLLAGMLRMGRQQRLRCAARLRVAHQDPTESHRGLARVIPERRVRGDIALAWWRIVEGGIEVQAREHPDTGPPRHQGEPCQGCPTALRHADPLAARHPAPHEPADLPGAVQQGVMAAAALGLEALGGTPHRQPGSGPDPVGPCYGGQHQTPEPAPATRFAHRRRRGPHGSPGDALRSPVSAPSAFDGVIQADEPDTSGDDHGDAEPEQPSTGVQRRPDGAIEDAMIRLQVGRCTAAHAPEHRRPRPLTWREDGAGHEDFSLLPHGSRNDRGKDPNGTAKGDRQREHGHPFRMKSTWVSLPSNGDPTCDKWIKPS
jgi:hypothetical protein